MSTLLRDVSVDGRRGDLRIDGTQVVAHAPRLRRVSGEDVVDGRGDSLLPGLHDHHLHLYALAARAGSISCGPPSVTSVDALVAALRAAPATPHGWLRGLDYHESVAGEPDRWALDSWFSDRPLRLQHRSGKLWMLNSAAVERLELQRFAPAEGIEVAADGIVTGRLFRRDQWLRKRLDARGEADSPPDLHAVSQRLAALGITYVTDASASNDLGQYKRFVEASQSGELLQHTLLMGDESLTGVAPAARVAVGPLKILLDEDSLPDLSTLSTRITAAHAAQRAVAFHCVTRIELLFALAALDESGSVRGDRIEHGGLIPMDVVQRLYALGLTVVTQPNFVAERGDSYRADVPEDQHADLYRFATLLRGGVPVGIGSDAPYGSEDPWRAIRAAATRRTASGALLGPAERVSEARALTAYLGQPHRPGGAPRAIRVGARADLVLLGRTSTNEAPNVRAVWVAGEPVALPHATDTTP